MLWRWWLLCLQIDSHRPLVVSDWKNAHPPCSYFSLQYSQNCWVPEPISQVWETRVSTMFLSVATKNQGSSSSLNFLALSFRSACHPDDFSSYPVECCVPCRHSADIHCIRKCPLKVYTAENFEVLQKNINCASYFTAYLFLPLKFCDAPQCPENGWSLMASYWPLGFRLLPLPIELFPPYVVRDPCKEQLGPLLRIRPACPSTRKDFLAGFLRRFA